MSEPIISTEPKAKQQGLYLVSTPIGNLRDITLRALDVFAVADAVLCEDSRVTGRLMQAYGFKKKLVVYNDHSDDSERAAILGRLAGGEMLALVTDAGTPLLSDPGYKLVQAALQAGVPVVPVPGASALLPALQLGALPSDRFLFAGFLPNKASARKAVFEELRHTRATLVFYESPNRIVDAVADAYAVLGDRPVAMAREITKMFEDARRGTLSAWVADETLLGTIKGEIVLMIGAPQKDEAPTESDLDAMLCAALASMSVKDAAASVSMATGVSKKQAYERALFLRERQSVTHGKE